MVRLVVHLGLVQFSICCIDGVFLVDLNLSGETIDILQISKKIIVPKPIIELLVRQISFQFTCLLKTPF